jgi:glycosyltransferase involved in cell wall biosynthesis
MIGKKTFICFGEDLKDTPFSRFHFMNLLSNENFVLYIESIGVRNPEFSRRDIKRILNKLGRILKGCQKRQDRFYILSPLILPFHGNELIRIINHYLLLIQMRFWINKFRLENIILWIGIPTAGTIIGKLKEELVVYHCADKLTAYVTEKEKKSITKSHAHTLHISNIAITPSKKYWLELRRSKEESYYLPHGVDYHHFSKASNGKIIRIPEDISLIKKPIIGFFGTIDHHWIDFNLLAKAAKQCDDCSIVLIGPINECSGTKMLRGYKNVYLLGAKKYKDLPNYASYFDVCIVPKVRTMLTEASSPLKIWEYMATGKPIVSTLEPEENLKSYIHVANNDEEFIKAIYTAIINDNEVKRNRRMEAVKKDSWESRVEFLSSLLEETLNRKINLT